MTYQKIKEEVVDKQGRLTTKQFTQLVIKLGLSYFGILLILSLAVSSLFGIGASVLVALFVLLAFLSTLDMYAEDEGKHKGVCVFANTWILYYILLIVEFLVLKYFMFI